LLYLVLEILKGPIHPPSWSIDPFTCHTGQAGTGQIYGSAALCLFTSQDARTKWGTHSGDLKKSYDCNQEAIQYASTTHVPDASGEVLAVAQQLFKDGLEIPTRKASKSSIQSTGDVALKTIQLQEGDSSKTAVIGAGLDEN
jgi:hypothetical protein